MNICRHSHGCEWPDVIWHSTCRTNGAKIAVITNVHIIYYNIYWHDPHSNKISQQWLRGQHFAPLIAMCIEHQNMSRKSWIPVGVGEASERITHTQTGQMLISEVASDGTRSCVGVDVTWICPQTMCDQAKNMLWVFVRTATWISSYRAYHGD